MQGIGDIVIGFYSVFNYSIYVQTKHTHLYICFLHTQMSTVSA